MKRKTSNDFKIAPSIKQETIKNQLLPYLLCAIAILVFYSLFYEMALVQDGLQLERLMINSIIVLVAVLLLLILFKRITFFNALVIIIVIGFIMRVGYMLYTPYDVRQHDIGVIGSAGHLDYIYTIFNTGSLPKSNAEQFYHPPFYYYLSAAVFKVATLFYNNNDFAFNAVRLIPCFASCATMIVSYKIFKNIKLSKPAILLAMTIVCMHPSFIYLGGSINNDMLSIFFITVTILYTIKWYFDQSYKNIIILAVALGLGMMTKLSVVMMAPIIAAVFLYVLIKNRKDRRLGDYVYQILAFGAISVPLGMWYSIRNLILYNQELGYVLKLSKYLNIYCGDYTIAQRFLTIPLQNLASSAFPDVISDYNVYLYTIKSSLFGEWSYNELETQAKLFAIVNIILILISLISMIYVFINAKNSINKLAKWFMALIWLVQIGAYIKFNIDYPFGCTMDFRYIVITVITGAGFIGLAYDIIKQKHNYLVKPVLFIMVLTVLLFSICSVWFYTSI